MSTSDEIYAPKDSSAVSESIHIDRFGGLRACEIPLSRISIFIGPQASGKSIAAKSIFFCKSYPREMLSAVFEDLNRQELHSKLKKKFSEYFRSASQEQAFSIRYENGEDFIVVKAPAERKSNRQIEINTSEYFDKEFASLRKVFGKFRRKAEAEGAADDFDYEFKFQDNYFNRHLARFGESWPVPQVFIPAGRAYYSFLQGSIFSLLSSNIPIDPFVREFGSSYERYKDFFFRRNATTGDAFKKQLEMVLRGSYVKREKQDFILTPDSRETLISNSSSGQQEVLPLLVMLEYFQRLSTVRGRGVYIEEPEAHLFPDSQRKLVELLAYVFSAKSKSSQLILTTHSPYVCSSANNLLLAGDILSKIPGGARVPLRGITSLGAYLEFDHLTASALADGSANSIIDVENRVIDTSYLDKASQDLMEQRERLLMLEEQVSGS